MKQAEKFRVRELVKKIESHPHRQALQADLQQSNAYNPFSEKSKKMIKDMGHVELFELSDKQTSGCEDHKCAHMWASGRDDDRCARGHFVQATAHLRKMCAALAVKAMLV